MHIVNPVRGIDNVGNRYDYICYVQMGGVRNIATNQTQTEYTQ